jgi:hypothetical protein
MRWVTTYSTQSHVAPKLWTHIQAASTIYATEKNSKLFNDRCIQWLSTSCSKGWIAYQKLSKPYIYIYKEGANLLKQPIPQLNGEAALNGSKRAPCQWEATPDTPMAKPTSVYSLQLSPLHRSYTVYYQCQCLTEFDAPHSQSSRFAQWRQTSDRGDFWAY